MANPDPIPTTPTWASKYTYWVFGETLAMMVLGWAIPRSAVWFRLATGSEVAGTVGYDHLSTFRLAGWLVTLTLLTLIMTTIGKGTTGFWRGALIDARNCISLSRIQMVLWTILVMSAWVAAVLGNYAVGQITNPDQAPGSAASVSSPGTTRVAPMVAIPGKPITITGSFPAAFQRDYLFFDGVPVNDVSSWSATSIVLNLPDNALDGKPWTPGKEVVLSTKDDPRGFTFEVSKNSEDAVNSPLDVSIPSELWAAMGISVISLVGAPLVTRKKVAKAKDDADKILDVREKDAAVSNSALLTKPTPADSSFSDIFQSEEAGNQGKMDLGKAQMFIFTAVLVSTYFAGCLAMFIHAGSVVIPSLPAISAGFVALLGLSHAGYLGFKAVPASNATPTDPNAGGGGAAVVPPAQNPAPQPNQDGGVPAPPPGGGVPSIGQPDAAGGGPAGGGSPVLPPGPPR